MRTKKLTITALMAALVTAMTMAIAIPIGNQGYLNFGDIMIFTSALLFGPQVGLIAGGIGSALADLLSGYGVWIPITLIAKGLEGYIAGLICFKAKSQMKNLIGIIISGFIMIFVYYIGGVILTFSSEGILPAIIASLSGIPFNILQVVVGAIGGNIIALLLKDKIKI
ncbi:ECF transporter S component [Defluviitalea phaphyphila]|uniref:ECF transporter S component n=1 Tax=Defluviitalea phaphyphila TaxID=1473580 RepID=UPI000731472D|nr:ECF transporter S component [Defluviitalea phaphyphila]